ncbi:MAG: tRNA guanosine(34) transglycosylase Tgt [Acidobacteriota bacterium]
MQFRILAEDSDTQARLGEFVTDHGVIRTPVFMPVGTSGTVKGITQDQLEAFGAEIILANTYHLYLRPGHELVASLGGLHKFISWPRPILTDSGGYQVFSHADLRRISEEGVTFRSHLDGSSHFLSPEISINIQSHLGADIVMAFDECTPYPADLLIARDSMERTLRWAVRSKKAFDQFTGERRHGHRQWLFGIGQGGIYPDLRCECVDRLIDIEFPGYAMGGLSVGEPKSALYEMVEVSTQRLPRSKPRYLMGVGTPLDLVECIAKGVDFFDCVLPTRNGRNGWLFTRSGHVVIKHARYARDESPIDPTCRCPVCCRYSRAYLRHLFQANEILAAVLNTFHNLYFYLDMVREIRDAIASKKYRDYLMEFKSRQETG